MLNGSMGRYNLSWLRQFRLQVQNETVNEATECYILMAIGINASGKIPVEYFLCNHFVEARLASRCWQR